MNGSRKRRIAAGSGTAVQDVNSLLTQFRQTQRMMKQLSSGRGLGGLTGDVYGALCEGSEIATLLLLVAFPGSG